MASLTAAISTLGYDASRAPSPILLAERDGDLRLANSRRGLAILGARGMRPGSKTTGALALRNLSDSPVGVSLRARSFRSWPGIHGGHLGGVLRLRVRQTAPHPTRVVYRGRLARLGRVGLGSWRPGQRRRYAFVVRFPGIGSRPSPIEQDNAYQGSRARVTFGWAASPAV